MSDWTDHAEHLTREDSEFSQLEPEPPAKCDTCGASLYIADRDNDNQCDECWAKQETITFEENQKRGLEELRQRKKLQEEISHRGLFND